MSNNNTHLPVEVQAQIEKQAKDYAQEKCDDLADKKGLHRKTLLMYAYKTGATEWAIWKAKYDELKQENSELKNELTAEAIRQEYDNTKSNYDALQKQYQQLKDKADKMEAALRRIALTIHTHPDYGRNKNIEFFDRVQEAHEAISAWKEGKEVEGER